MFWETHEVSLVSVIASTSLQKLVYSPVHRSLPLGHSSALNLYAPSLSANSTDQYYPLEISTEETHPINCEPIYGFPCSTLYSATLRRRFMVNNEPFKPIRTMPDIEHDSNTLD